MAYQECSVWIELVDRYGSAAADFSRSLQASKPDSSPARLAAVEAAQLRMQGAWESLESHMREHRCQGVSAGTTRVLSGDQVMAEAASAAPDIILVADDDRRFVEVNQAAEELLGLPRDQIVGKRVDDFFSAAQGKTVPEAWDDFVAAGVQSGICHFIEGNSLRPFDYRARANFLPGLHVSVMRETT